MRAIARAGLSAALNNPVDGLVLAKWKQKVNLREELILIPNIKDFKTMATRITGINFEDDHYPKLLIETMKEFETNESVIVGFKKNTNIRVFQNSFIIQTMNAVKRFDGKTIF